MMTLEECITFFLALGSLLANYVHMCLETMADGTVVLAQKLTEANLRYAETLRFPHVNGWK